MRRRLGTSGLSVTPLALGTMTWGNAVDRHDAGDHLRAFLDAGGNLVDTAYGYGGGESETILGELLADTVDRSELVLCTKSGISRTGGARRVDVSRRGLMAQLETSLRRLGTDHVDLWLVHTWSDEVPLAETLSALEWAADVRPRPLRRGLQLRRVAVRSCREPARAVASSLGGQRGPVLPRMPFA